MGTELHLARSCGRRSDATYGLLFAIISLSKFIKQARASTKSLLSESYEEAVIDTTSRCRNIDRLPFRQTARECAFETELPYGLGSTDPPNDISAHSEERLKVGLRFADHSLRNKERKVSPIAYHCLTLYKATVKAALEKEHDDNNEKNELLSSVLLFERDIYTRAFLRRPVDIGNLQLIERLSQLRRFEFAARYGDYLAHEARDPAITEADIMTIWAALNACNSMGLNFDRVRQTIAIYADRNSLVHASIQRLVEQGQWHILKDTLAQDLVDIPIVTPSHLRGNIPLLQEIVQAVIDTYFDRRGGHHNDPNFWTPKEEAYDRSAKMAERKDKKMEAVLAKRKLVEKLAAKRCAKLIAESSMVYLAAATLGTDAPSGDLPADVSHKRPLAEADRTEKLEILKRRKIA
ncbi:hypothetical protein OCS_04251 [Ophiocordyceps sinensis CO18]|uniref:Uncharacterized protein n=1 Tax=Ophiocordyceps sinensis (strain Co18 / CGMCC 3.14243) TaxID=911162 RepID=T5AE66_OPHSC|nr:hypothetical protein OCS_04251 [Ophiocordyceps sinensis CO18]